MKKRDFFWGSFFIVIAVILIGNIFDLFYIGEGLFQIIITIFLIALAISNLPEMRFYGIIMPLSVALVLNQSYFGMRNNFWWILWAGFFLSAGLSLIFKPRRQKYFEKEFINGDGGFESYDEFKSGDSENADFVRISTNFADRTRYLHSSNFKGGYIENNFGSVRVYFDQCALSETGANVQIDCNFGQILLYIPATMPVINNIHTTLGSVTDEFRRTEVSGPTLVLHGDVTFGNVKIIYI